jgi:hypothetical protein
MKTSLDYCCDIFKSGELIAKGAFGLHEPHRMLKERLGDYVIIMKNNYILKDTLLNEDRNPLFGNHGGLSKEEMYVPLVWLKNI